MSGWEFPNQDAELWYGRGYQDAVRQEQANNQAAIDEIDIRVDVYTSGIQRRDNPASWPAVRITHIPSGIVETDQSTPSQLQNKAAALKRLAARVGVLVEGEPK